MDAHIAQVGGRPGWRQAIVAAVATLVLAVVGLPVGSVGSTYVVDAGSLLPAGARVIDAMPALGVWVVTSPVTPAGAAAADSPVRPESLLVTGEDGFVLDSAVASTGAPSVWSTTRGERAVVALIDTGVADVPALDGAVAGEIDFSGTGGGDGFGHGTFMASVIAGRGQVAPGVAPGAGILSLKVAGPDGSTSLGSVLAALDWLHGPGRSAGIRVAALAMAVEPGTQAARILDQAVQRLAAVDVLVLTAAGNDGPQSLTSPATSRGSFSVGAVDDGATADRSDDVLAPFSGTGVDARGVAQPDVTASGVAVTGSLPAGSIIALGATPSPEGLYRGTGTSMATAVAAGVAALASSARPDLGGAALDAALRAGGGQVDAPAALAAVLAAPQTPGGNGGGGNGGGGNGGNRPDGSAAPQSIRWTSIRWTSIRWTGEHWGDADWGMAVWGSIRWTAQGWQYAEVTPQTIRWTTIRWTTIRWTAIS